MKQQNKTCLGCGTYLQTNNVSQTGYVIKLDNDYCQSCFKLANYGVASTHEHPNLLPEFEDNSLVVVITSVLFLDTLFKTNLKRLTNNQVVYVINQIDLLPKDTNLDLFIKNLETKARQTQTEVADIILMSAHNQRDLANLKEYLLDYQQTKIYLVGIQNSGKTTIFKYLTNNTTALNLKKAALTQTTLTGKMGNKTILDTPGLYQTGYLHELYPYDVYKRILPEKTIRPIIYNLKAKDVTIIDGLVAIEIVKIVRPSVVFYLNQNLKIHKTNVNKLTNLLANYQQHFKYGFDDYQATTFKLEKNIKYQVTLADFGFIHLIGPATIKVHSPKNLHLTLMEALFK